MGKREREWFLKVLPIPLRKKGGLWCGAVRREYKDIVGLRLSLEVPVGRKVCDLGIELRRDI